MQQIPAGAVLIVDNGCEYSAHEIYFVSTDGFPSDLVSVFVQKIFESDRASRVGSIVGVAESVDWWEGGAQDFTAFLEDAFGHQCTVFPRAAWFFAGVADNVARQIADAWLQRFVDDAQERLPRVQENARPGILAAVEKKRAWRLWFDEFLARRARGDFDEDGNWRPGAPGAPRGA